jgi:hypothetical protein
MEGQVGGEAQGVADPKKWSVIAFNAGSYQKHECGIRIGNVTTQDAGGWTCSLESFHNRQLQCNATMNILIEERPATRTTTITTTKATTTTSEDSRLACIPIPVIFLVACLLISRHYTHQLKAALDTAFGLKKWSPVQSNEENPVRL